MKLDWPLRLKIAIGTAKGLAYLHSDSDIGVPIVHRDFKSSNILLNHDYEPKVYIFKDRMNYISYDEVFNGL